MTASRLLSLALATATALVGTAQDALVLGEPAPPVTVTHYLANAPTDTARAGQRPLVLEFWATWCGPCIAAVPHLNELHGAYAGRGVDFLSLTYEPPVAVERLLRRVSFATPVATDTTEATFAAYGDGEGLSEYPLTVLLDGERRVRWVGTPEELTAPMLDSLLAGTLTPRNTFAEREARTGTEGDPTEEFVAILKNKTRKYRLDVLAPRSEEDGASLSGPGMYFHTGASVVDFYRDALGQTAEADSALAAERFYFRYLNRAKPPVPPEVVEAELLRALELEREALRRYVTEYALTVVDASRLPAAADRRFVAMSEAGAEVVYTGASLGTVAEDLGKRLGVGFALVGEDDGAYDLLVGTDSLAAAVASLRGYGLSVTEGEVEVEVAYLRRE